MGGAAFYQNGADFSARTKVFKSHKTNKLQKPH
jgi:hypothetical protein